MMQTCLSILTGALAGVAVYKIQKCKDKNLKLLRIHSFRMSNLSKPYSAEDVANFIIDYVNVELGSAINNWMLNCILYYVQGIFLANGSECFKEDIWAYTICPVVPCVYESYVDNGRSESFHSKDAKAPYFKSRQETYRGSC